MSGMRAFTFDFESTELSVEEAVRFGMLVKSLCYPDLQTRISAWLAAITRPQPMSVCDHIGRQAERAWRLESRM